MSELEEQQSKAAHTASWWGEKLSLQYTDLAYQLEKKLAQSRPANESDPFTTPDYESPPYTPEQLALKQRLENIEQRVKELSQTLRTDPFTERVEAYEETLSTHPLIQRLRAADPLARGLRKEHALGNLHEADIIDRETQAEEPGTPLPPSLSGLDKARHILEEISGLNMGLRGKNGEGYAEEYMREKVENYQGAIADNQERTQTFKQELLKALRETKAHELSNTETPSRGDWLRADEASRDALRMMEQEQIDDVQKLMRPLPEEPHPKSPPPDIVYFSPQNVDILDTSIAAPRLPAAVMASTSRKIQLS